MRHKAAKKEFNDVGGCVPGRHYMVDISDKIAQIIGLIEQEKYFTINRARQFGKTTTLFLLHQTLNRRSDYLAVLISFEGIGDAPFASEQLFCSLFLCLIADALQFTAPEQSHEFEQAAERVNGFYDLSRFITNYVRDSERNIVLLIDEVDQSSNNQIFLSFLGLLRQKYLARNYAQDYTFHAVILAGVHDVKTLKVKLEQSQQFNSPWNIAIDFEIDLSFSAPVIERMLEDYSRDNDAEITPDVPAIAERIYYYSSGYPYLVSKLCKFIDEKVIAHRADRTWQINDVETALQMLVDERYTTTLFDSLTKNLENHPDLYDSVFELVINGKQIPFNQSLPAVSLGVLYGFFKSSPERACQIHNRIFEQRLYNYFVGKQITASSKSSEPLPSLQPEFYTPSGLNIMVILQRFQTFMREHYAHKEARFLEREGRLLFLSFLRPIINGKGFDFKEPNVSDERRMDIVITYQRQRYVIELKRWYDPKAHQQGLRQLCAYLESYSLQQGYLLIFDFRKEKIYQQSEIEIDGKQIFAVWV